MHVVVLGAVQLQSAFSVVALASPSIQGSNATRNLSVSITPHDLKVATGFVSVQLPMIALVTLVEREGCGLEQQRAALGRLLLPRRLLEELLLAHPKDAHELHSGQRTLAP